MTFQLYCDLTFDLFSSYSVSDLLFARNDPEELLLSLGFGGQKEPDPLARIPSRFMKRPSIARGISVQNFLMVSETPDQKLGMFLNKYFFFYYLCELKALDTIGNYSKFSLA